MSYNCKNCSRVTLTNSARKLCTLCEEQRISQIYADVLIKNLKRRSKNPSNVLLVMKNQFQKMKLQANAQNLRLLQNLIVIPIMFQRKTLALYLIRKTITLYLTRKTILIPLTPICTNV